MIRGGGGGGIELFSDWHLIIHGEEEEAEEEERESKIHGEGGEGRRNQVFPYLRKRLIMR